MSAILAATCNLLIPEGYHCYYRVLQAVDTGGNHSASPGIYSLLQQAYPDRFERDRIFHSRKDSGLFLFGCHLDNNEGHPPATPGDRI